MANITYDGQSLIVDGRRVWLVSGTIHYLRTPHPLWRQRVRAARQAGLNCIQTYVFWNAHEPQPGRFRFDGDYDLRRFIKIVAEEGMYCILRPGPYACAEWDFGGFPAWLLNQPGVRLREGEPQYLQACARYLEAVMGQVADLQITHPEGGPIVLIQVENEWFCSNEPQAEQYHGQLARFLRETGAAVPLINCNNLWQQVANTIDCWNGWDRLLQNMRQLQRVQPDAPRVVTELWPGWFDVWGGEHHTDKTAAQMLARIADVSAAGAQFNLYMFHGGTNFAFWAGQNNDAPHAFNTTSYDYDAPLTEAGGRGPKYLALKRIAPFLSSFDQLMANLDPELHPAAAARNHGRISVVQQSGSMGDVVFITRDEPCRPATVDLISPLGQTLPVHLGHDAAAWVVFDAKLDGQAVLDVTNLRPWAFVERRMLVLYGPASTQALVSIDGAVLDDQVPAGAAPKVVRHQDLTVVLCSDKQIDQAYLHDDGRLFVGVGGFDDAGEPLRGASGSYTIVSPDGETTQRRMGAKPRRPAAPPLGEWRHADVDAFVDGTAPRYAAIDGPRSLEACGADFGYGWYRIRLHRGKAGRVNLLCPEARDRLHLYRDGKLDRIIGVGPGAVDQPVPVSLPGGTTDLVFLADNLGRYKHATADEAAKGLSHHLYHVTAVRLNKPKRRVAPMPDPFELYGFVHGARRGDRSLRPHYDFEFTHRRKTSLLLAASGKRPRALVLVNDQPVALDQAWGLDHQFTLHSGQHLKQGKNTLTIVPLNKPREEHDLSKAYKLLELAERITDKADWAYARWQVPDAERFGAMPRATGGRPGWFRTTFSLNAIPEAVWLRIAGMSKGQVYLNGHNVGRYWVASPTGQKVPPQTDYYLPEPWLSVDQPNELILFDEHGKRPTRCSIVFNAMGPYR